MNIVIIGGTGMSDLLAQHGLKGEKQDNNRTGDNYVYCTVFPYRQEHNLVFLSRHTNSGQATPAHMLRHQNYMSFLTRYQPEFILASSTVGASRIKGGFSPGSIVVPDDVIDYVNDSYSFASSGFSDPARFHRPTVNLFCPQLRASLRGLEGYPPGHYLLANSIRGPRFETRAEMAIRVRDGVHLVGMPTAFPEAVLAGELAIPYAVLCGVSNMAPADEDGEAVERVMARLAKKMAKRLLQATDIIIDAGGHDKDCPCQKGRENSVFV